MSAGNIKEFVCTTSQEWVTAVVDRIERELNSALAARNCATLMLSGGSTPSPIYQALSERALDWANIKIALVDERWVPLDHAGSNEALLRQNMLINNAAEAQYQPIQQPGDTPFDADWSAHFNGMAPFDVVVLGMGPDGHTASLFPHAEGLEHALTTEQWVAPIKAIQSEVTGELVYRITMTRHALANAGVNIMLFKGAAKKAVFDACKEGEDSYDKPVRVLWQAGMPPLEVYLLDEIG